MSKRFWAATQDLPNSTTTSDGVLEITSSNYSHGIIIFKALSGPKHIIVINLSSKDPLVISRYCISVTVRINVIEQIKYVVC